MPKYAIHLRRFDLWASLRQVENKALVFATTTEYIGVVFAKDPGEAERKARERKGWDKWFIKGVRPKAKEFNPAARKVQI